MWISQVRTVFAYLLCGRLSPNNMERNIKDKQEMASHKLIEKRRRDRINNCLLELTQAVPAAFSKQNSGKLEKAEILEMTVEYLRAVHKTQLGLRLENGEWYSCDIWGDFLHHYQTGYSDCMTEVIRYLSQIEGADVTDTRCCRLLTFLQSRFRPDNSVTRGGSYTHLPGTKEGVTYDQTSSEPRHHLTLPIIQLPVVSQMRPNVVNSTNRATSIHELPHVPDTHLRLGVFTVPQSSSGRRLVRGPGETQRYFPYNVSIPLPRSERTDKRDCENRSERAYGHIGNIASK